MKHLINKKRGAISLELLFNFLIYIIIFIFLFSLLTIPIKIFYLKCASRDAIIIYAQLQHFSGSKDLYEQAKYLMGDKDNTELKSDVKEVTIGPNKKIALINTKGNCKKDVALITSYYVTRNLFQEKSLSSRLFRVEELTININDEATTAGNIFQKLGSFFKSIVYTYNLSVSITYPITVFRITDFSNANTNIMKFEIKGETFLKYNK
ncbi:MAG: hypothetical protein QW735_02970 [archaeon]